MSAVRSLYLGTLCAAMTRPARGERGGGLDAFLSLNAGYFLGEWLPKGLHERLVERLARRLDGLADLVVPADQMAALQLAQHAREITAAFGPNRWTERIVAATVGLVPAREPRVWVQIEAALEDVAAGRDGAPLLRLHAERRLWALTHGDDAAESPVPAPAWALALARQAAESADGRAVQVAEVALAELAYSGVRSMALDERNPLLDPGGTQGS